MALSVLGGVGETAGDGSFTPNTVKVPASSYYDNYYQIANAETNIFDASFGKLGKYAWILICRRRCFPKSVCARQAWPFSDVIFTISPSFQVRSRRRKPEQWHIDTGRRACPVPFHAHDGNEPYPEILIQRNHV